MRTELGRIVTFRRSFYSAFPSPFGYGSKIPVFAGINNSALLNGGYYAPTYPVLPVYGNNWRGWGGWGGWWGGAVYPYSYPHPAYGGVAPGYGSYSYGGTVGYTGGLGNCYSGIGYGGSQSHPAGSPSSFSYSGMCNPAIGSR